MQEYANFISAYVSQSRIVNCVLMRKLRTNNASMGVLQQIKVVTSYYKEEFNHSSIMQLDQRIMDCNGNPVKHKNLNRKILVGTIS